MPQVLEANDSGTYTFPKPQIHCKFTASLSQSMSNYSLEFLDYCLQTTQKGSSNVNTVF